MKPRLGSWIADEAYAAYQKHGMQGVEDVARKHRITTRTYCVPCEANTPYYRGECLTCGSPAAPIPDAQTLDDLPPMGFLSFKE